ncbi:MAG: GTP-binding protein [Rhodospirillaceae bacterium]
MPTAAAAERPNRVPISIVTGFLGSGKTTLLNRLVKQTGMAATALIINEFGEVGLDNLLVETAIENTLVLENGCICCSVRGDLIDTIGDLFAKAANGEIPDFDRILIETTGLADPVPIVNTLRNEAAVARRCRMDGVVTVIDGVQGERQAHSHAEAMAQIAQADIGLISKRDLIDDTAYDGLVDFLHGVNPVLELAPMAEGWIDPARLFGADRGLLPAEPEGAAPDGHAHHDHGGHAAHASHHRHGNVATWSYAEEAPLDGDRLFAWLRMLYSLRSLSVLRMKGLVRLEGEPGPVLIEAVGPVVSPLRRLPEWPGGRAANRLVLIFKDLAVASVRASFLRHVVGAACLENDPMAK